MNAMPPTPSKKAKRGKRKPGPPPLPQVVLEHNLSLRYGRGDVRVEHNAPDPDRPNRTISRARAFSALERLAVRGTINVGQAEAAEKYQILYEVESGAQWQSGERNGGALPAWQKGFPSIEQVQAAADLRRVHDIIGARARRVLTLLLIDNLPATAIAEKFGALDRVTKVWVPEEHRIVVGWIKLILERLAEHWGLTNESISHPGKVAR